MLVYYHFAGLVADLCLTLNLILLFGIMAVIDSAFTLPGLAGIALTIGIAVDSNVLIYERIREERERGSSLRMSIHNGFDRALSAIIDSNVTTLISAVILYMIGTDQIRGFAVTLFIGLVVSLFTVLYFGRMVFDIAEKKRWIKKLTMMKLFGPHRFRLHRQAEILRGAPRPSSSSADSSVSRSAATTTTTSTSPAARWSRSSSPNRNRSKRSARRSNRSSPACRWRG